MPRAMSRGSEIFVVLGFTFDDDLFLKEIPIDGAIEYVSDNVVIETDVRGMSISQPFRKALVLHHCLELIFTGIYWNCLAGAPLLLYQDFPQYGHASR